MVDSTFWNQQAERFQSLRQEVERDSQQRQISVSYHPDGWGFEEIGAFRGKNSGQWLLEGGSNATIEDFKSIASLCAVALRSPNTASAWTDWLELIRRDGIGFDPEEFVVETVRREWRPEPDVELTATGLMAAPQGCKPDPEPEIVSASIGGITDVVGVSNRLCRRLADEALKGELASRTPETAVRQSVIPDLPKVSVIPESARSSRPAPLLPSPLPAHAQPVPSPHVTAGLDTSKAMTLKEAAKALGVSEDTVLRMQDRGEIALFKAGSRWKVLASEVFRIRQQPRFEYR